MGIIAVFSLIVTALAAVPAFADPVATEPSVDASGNLPVSFTENLPLEFVDQPFAYTLTGLADATYVCLKKNGRAPKGGPIVAGTVSGAIVTAGPTSFVAQPALDEFGNPIGSSVSGSLTLSPPPPTGLSCPSSRLRLVLAHVSYYDITLENVTFAGIPTLLVGPYSRTLI